MLTARSVWILECYNSENASVIVAAMKYYMPRDLQSVWLIEAQIPGRLFGAGECGQVRDEG